MSDRPTEPPSDDDPQRPDQTVPAAADDTAVLPQGVAGPDVSTTAEGAPGPAPDGPAGHPAPGARAPGAPLPMAAAGAAAGGGGSRRWWGEATSTSGGRAALVVAAVLGSVVLLAGVALLGGAVGRAAGWSHDRMGFADQRFSNGERPDGPGRSADAPGRQKDKQQQKQGKDKDKDARGGRQGNGIGQGMGQAMGRAMGQGLGVLGADVLHGEFTTTVGDTKSVMVVQTGEVTTYTSGRSLTLRSTDGFEATYALDGSIASPREVTRLATGALVRVVAAKEGMKVTRLVVIG